MAVVPGYPLLGTDSRQLRQEAHASRHASLIANFCNKIGARRK